MAARRPAGASPWGATLRELQTHVRRDRVSVSAGSLAYHGFLAFFPAVIAALGVLTLVHVGAGTLHHLLHAIGRALPAGASGVVNAAVTAATSRKGSVTAVAIGAVVALWSATSATAVLQQVLDIAYEVPADRKFVARRLRGLPLLGLTAVFGGLSAALIVFGEPIGSAIRGVLPIGGVAFVVGWTAFRWVVALALVSLLFSTYYAFAPNRQSRRFRWATPGSLLATAVFLAGSLGFSFYISTFSSYGRTYGSFAGVAIFIFWLYLTSLAVLIGGELNAELEREGKLRPPARVRRPGAPTARGTPAPAAAGAAGVPGAAGPQPSADAPRRAAG